MQISLDTKLKQHRGEGHYGEYNPWIHTNEIKGHLGTHHNPIDWKHGRSMHFLSDGEYWLYMILRFQDEVLDIREQFPLPVISTEYITDKKGWIHPSNKEGLIPFTTDLLVDYVDGHQEAYSVKYSLEELQKHPNQIKNVWIQKKYWNGLPKPVQFFQVFTVDMNRVYAENIARVVQYWWPETVTDKVSLYLFMLAHKKIEVDMKSDPLDDIMLCELANSTFTDSQYFSLSKKIKELKAKA